MCPTELICLEIYGFQIYDVQLVCPTTVKLWIPFLENRGAVPNPISSCPGQMTPEVKWPMQIAPIKPAAVPMFPPHTSPLPTALMRNEA